jgi:hypothetical protein
VHVQFFLKERATLIAQFLIFREGRNFPYFIIFELV